METLIFNLSGGVRREMLDDRQHVVVDAVMMVEGVWKGSDGDYYYSAEDMAKGALIANHKPTVVFHPKKADGTQKTASDPAVITNRQAGIILNSRVEDKKWKAEVWLDEAKTNKIDSRIISNLDAGNKVEVSIGVHADKKLLANEAEYGGKKYTCQATNLRLDHLAILPDGRGACSVEDGAGLLANQKVEPLVVNAASFDDIRCQIGQQLYAANTIPGYDWSGWLYDVFQDFFVYRQDGKFYKMAYSVKDDLVSITGGPVEVVRVTEYRTADGTYVGNAAGGDSQQERTTMAFDKKAHIDGLVGNGWEEADRAVLTAMPDGQLAKIKPTPKVETPPPVTNAPPVVKEEQKSAVVPGADKKLSWSEIVANADPGAADVLNEMSAGYNTIKAALVEKIKAAPGNTFTEVQLTNMKVSDLKPIAALVGGGSVGSSSVNPPIYAGLGQLHTPIGNAAPVDEVPLVVGRPKIHKAG